MGEFESGLGQRDLSLPNDKSQDLIITQVSVGLRSKLKQLPYNHTKRPGKIHRWRVRRCFSSLCSPRNSFFKDLQVPNNEMLFCLCCQSHSFSPDVIPVLSLFQLYYKANAAEPTAHHEK